MAVFFDTGNGDIYGGFDKAAVLAAMHADYSDISEPEVFEVPGTQMMQASDENDQPTGDLISLNDEYGADSDAYCVASKNC